MSISSGEIKQYFFADLLAMVEGANENAMYRGWWGIE